MNATIVGKELVGYAHDRVRLDVVLDDQTAVQVEIPIADATTEGIRVAINQAVAVVKAQEMVDKLPPVIDLAEPVIKPADINPAPVGVDATP